MIIIINKIPSKETQWMEYIIRKNENDIYVTHIVTSNQDRSLYYLYEVRKEGYEKIGKSKTPAEFDEIVYGKEGNAKSKKKK